MPVQGMTPEEVAAATRAVVAAGGKSTDRANRLPGETATEANARITAAYKTETVKPILTPEQIAGGMTVQYVRTQAGGFGEYAAIKPIGYTGPTKITSFTEGVIPVGSKYTTTGGTTTGTTTQTTVTEVGRVTNPDGTVTITYSDGSKKTLNPSNPVTQVTEVSRVTNPDGTITITYSDGTKRTTSPSSPLVGSTTSVISTPTGPTLASDVFKQTLAIFFGPAEMGKAWVNELYNVVSRFYKQGVTTEEAFNMAVLDSEKNPALADFTKRFKGIYALQKMKQEGKAVTVPTIAEYFATEAKMGDVLKQSSLGELANEDFLGDVLSKGVSATEFANRITAIFDRIDNAPKDIKDTLSRYFPTVDRISLAKAIALGDKGAKELQNKVAGYEVLSAAEKQGLGAGQLAGGVTEERAYQYALGGETFDTALTKFGTVAAALPTVNKLTQIYGEPMLGPSGIEEAVFGKSAKQIKAMEDLAQREQASFSGRSGVTQGSLASQRRGAGII
jgi:hypothetical protein